MLQRLWTGTPVLTYYLSCDMLRVGGAERKTALRKHLFFGKEGDDMPKSYQQSLVGFLTIIFDNAALTYIRSDDIPSLVEALRSILTEDELVIICQFFGLGQTVVPRSEIVEWIVSSERCNRNTASTKVANLLKHALEKVKTEMKRNRHFRARLEELVSLTKVESRQPEKEAQAALRRYILEALREAPQNNSGRRIKLLLEKALALCPYSGYVVKTMPLVGQLPDSTVGRLAQAGVNNTLELLLAYQQGLLLQIPGIYNQTVEEIVEPFLAEQYVYYPVPQKAKKPPMI